MSRRGTPTSARSTPSGRRKSGGGSGSGFPPLAQTQKHLAVATKNMPPGLVSRALPASVGLVVTNPRFESSNKGSFKAPPAALSVGGGINSKYTPVTRGFSYSFPGMYQDTGIGSLEKEADRREMHIRSAKERLERLERLKIEQDEKRRVREALREKKRQEKAMFNYAVTSLQSAWRGQRDREVVGEAMHQRRQQLRVVHALQSAVRGQKGRALAHARKTVVVGAASKIQRRYTARLQYKKAQTEIEQMLEARELARQRALEAFEAECATQVQAFYRGSRDRASAVAKKRKRDKRLKALQSKEAAMKAKLAAMAGGKKPKPKSKPSSPKHSRRSSASSTSSTLSRKKKKK